MNMKQILLLVTLFTLFLTPALAQENANCPKIKLTAPKNIAMQGEVMVFSVSLNGEVKGLELEYKWTVTAGTISQGQGTPIIIVDTTGLSDIKISTTVEIKGLAKSCPNVFSETGFVKRMVPIIDCVSYDNLPLSDELARLEPIPRLIKVYPNSFVQFFIITKKGVPAISTRARIGRILNYLSKRKKVAKNKLVFTVRQDDYESTQICIWTKRDEIIKCKDCETIKGEDFTRKNPTK